MRVSWNETDRERWQVLDVSGAGRRGLAMARHWAGDRLATLGETDRIDTLMVVGELLENAYVHAGGARELRLHQAHEPHESCEVTVAVADVGTGEPRLRVPDRGGGRGLLLVDRLCRTWGVSRHDDGKLVWGRIRCEEPGAA